MNSILTALANYNTTAPEVEPFDHHLALRNGDSAYLMRIRLLDGSSFTGWITSRLSADGDFEFLPLLRNPDLLDESPAALYSIRPFPVIINEDRIVWISRTTFDLLFTTQSFG